MNPFQRAARIFLFIFVISAILFVLLIFANGRSGLHPTPTATAQAISPTQGSGNPQPTEEPNQPDTNKNPDQNPSIWNSAITVITTVSTSIASFVGFIFTTIIGWRKEKRESALADIQRKQLEAELKKSKLETEKLKQASKKKSAAKKKK
jgi:hypothetical protein